MTEFMAIACFDSGFRVCIKDDLFSVRNVRVPIDLGTKGHAALRGPVYVVSLLPRSHNRRGTYIHRLHGKRSTIKLPPATVDLLWSQFYCSSWWTNVAIHYVHSYLIVCHKRNLMRDHFCQQEICPVDDKSCPYCDKIIVNRASNLLVATGGIGFFFSLMEVSSPHCLHASLGGKLEQICRKIITRKFSSYLLP